MFENNLSLLSAAIEKYSNNRNAYVLGIDPSLADTAVGVSRIGWKKMLVFDSPDIIRTKSKEYSPCQRIAFTREYLQDLVKKYPAQLVTIEGYAYGREQNRELMGEVGGMIRLNIFYDNPNEIGPVILVGPTQLKKYILNNCKKIKPFLINYFWKHKI
jgi:Holliday junction resolvasome RuvABC endonuclease subunit